MLRLNNSLADVFYEIRQKGEQISAIILGLQGDMLYHLEGNKVIFHEHKQRIQLSIHAFCVDTRSLA